MNLLNHRTAWVLLLLLMAGIAIASNFGGTSSILIIGLLSGLKFFIIAFQFMGVKRAHWGWKLIVLMFILLFVLFVFGI